MSIYYDNDNNNNDIHLFLHAILLYEIYFCLIVCMRSRVLVFIHNGFPGMLRKQSLYFLIITFFYIYIIFIYNLIYYQNHKGTGRFIITKLSLRTVICFRHWSFWFFFSVYIGTWLNYHQILHLIYWQLNNYAV